MLIHDEILKIAAAGVKLHHLANLLLKGHTREQVGDSLTSGQIRILVRQGFSSCGRRSVVGHTKSLSSVKSNSFLITNW